MNHEGVTISKVQIWATENGWRVFRNSVGLGWAGNVSEEYKIRDKSGRELQVVELTGARRVHYGLVRGSSDLIGWRPLVITADMVGKTVAQFTAVECKTRAYKRLTPEQSNFLTQVDLAGGAAYVARETNDGLEIEQVDKIFIEGA